MRGGGWFVAVYCAVSTWAAVLLGRVGVMRTWPMGVGGSVVVEDEGGEEEAGR
ncbi:hypothetical protein FH972_023530 [Carpinus fangiana]|uniref:Uncharacterized protein n=1 Tax=Carpinus fangiana TaxID=176857 RepID=A0A5N6KVF2_9ROSI|nr:hypothetical protein FH972_023530 [Carpinus fangiana]